MPFKSDKQKKYFFAKLNSLPKGSHEYNKWKKVVDKFVAHSVDESQDLDEARRNPEVNVDQPIAKQVEQFINKYIGQEDLVFVSFRDDVHVTFINPKNVYGTPTGIYTYPWTGFYDDKFQKYVKNYLVPDLGTNIPFGGGRKYMFMYKLKSNQGILTNRTTYNDTLVYAKRLQKIVTSNEQAEEIVRSYVEDYEDYIEFYYNNNNYANSYFGDVHKFWVLLYEVAQEITKGKPQDTLANLCRAIGVNGFVDFDGKGYIHPSEPKQAVFFRGRELFSDIKIINTQSSQSKVYNRNLLDYINNKEFIDNLNSDRVKNLLDNAPNEKFILLIIDTLLSNKNFVSNMDNGSFNQIINSARLLNNYDYYIEINDRIIRTVLSNDNFLDTDSSNKIYNLLRDTRTMEQRMSIIDVLLTKESFLKNINEDGIKNIVHFTNYENKNEVIQKIVNNSILMSNIIKSNNGIVISYLISEISEKYRPIIIDTLLSKEGILDDLKNVYPLLYYSTPEKGEEILDKLLENKTFILNLKLELGYENPIISKFFLSKLSKEIKQKIADKIIELRPDILQKLLNNMDLGLILDNTSFDKDSLLNDVNFELLLGEGHYIRTIFTILTNVSHPKDFVKKIGEEKLISFFNFIGGDEYTYKRMIKEAKNKQEINEIIKTYTDNDYSNEIETPINEIFNSLTSLQKELTEQNKMNTKQKNLEKVKDFLLKKKKPLLEDEFYFNTLPDDKKESIYNTFTKSYETSVGASWSRDKFYSRAYNWLFFGDENGFVAVRPQKSGLYKLVGVGGNPKSILNGFNELQSKNIPIWGMVSKEIQLMAHKKGFTTPPPFLLKILYKLIPNSVFGDSEFDVNSDGSLTLKYSDVGDAVKYFIGNDEYFKNLKTNILPSMKNEFSKLPSLTKMMINKFLPESSNNLNEELLDEDITSGSVIVYHRTGKKGSPIKGIAADGYRVGGGALYGVGVYTTYDLESQLDDYLRTNYGNIIIESKVLSMDKFLIFDYDIAKKIYGNVNYTLDNQLRLILGNNWKNFKDNDILKELIDKVTVVKYTSDVADDFHKYFTDTIVKYLRGIVFTGRNDGKVLVSYDRENIEPLRYTTDEGQTWTNIINKNIYQRIKGYKSEEKETYFEHILNKLDVKPDELTDGEINYIVNNIPLFLKRGSTLGKIIEFIIRISNGDSKKIIQYIKNIFEKNGEILPSFVTKEDAMYMTREYNIPKIYSKIIFKLLIKYGGIEFINKIIGDEGIPGFYWFGEISFYRNIIDTILKHNGKEFLLKNFSELDTILYQYFNLFSKDKTINDSSDKFINKMIKIGGKELLYKLATNIRVISNSKIPLIQTFLFKITDKNYPAIIDNMLKIGGKEFVNVLDVDTLRYMYTKYQNSESLTQKLLKISGKEFVDKHKDKIFYLIPNYKDYEKIRDMFSMYDTENLPLNEIFNSLTSLQKELNKQKNLEKVNQFLLERKGFISEDFKSQEQNYINQGFNSNIVKSYIERFRKIKDKNYKQIDSQDLNNALKNVKDRRNIDSYKTFKELETFVDYVKGQVDLEGVSLGKDIEIDAKPYYENDVFEIYYADSPKACIKYKGNISYGWCVSQKEGNMYYAYRYRENEPTFYFVKIKDRTKKELETFSGQFKDKYHFFVVQVEKSAKIGDKTTKQYVVTSAINDGDAPMSWDEIVAIEPRIANLQEIFKSVPINPEDRAFYNKYSYNEDEMHISYYQYKMDKEYCKFDYVHKKKYLDMIIGDNVGFTDKQFKCSPDDLKNLYIGFGFGLSDNQFELIKNNKNLLKRFKQIAYRKYEEALKNNRDFQFTHSELIMLPKNALTKTDLSGFFGLAKDDDTLEGRQKQTKELDYITSELTNKEILLGMNPKNFKIFAHNKNKGSGGAYPYATKYPELIQSLGKKLIEIGGEDLINKFINEPISFYYFIFMIERYKGYLEIVNNLFSKLIDKGGKEFLIKLSTTKSPEHITRTLLEELFTEGMFSYVDSKNKRRFLSNDNINKMLNVGGKEFIDTLDEKLVKYFIMNSENPEQVKELFQKYGKLPKDDSTTPLNEIFKSLTSLQEELIEQNKINTKQKNLEKVNQFLLERKGFISEDFKSQEQNYINQGNDPQIVKTYIERFRKIRDKNYKQLNDQIDALKNVKDRRNIDSYKTFKELETIVDYVKGQVDLEGVSLGKDIEIDAKPIYEDDVFQIYYADSPRACIKYKGNIPYGWCVSQREGNMYYTLRYKPNEPSFYFVKVKDRTKKELGFFNMVGNVFNGQFKDKYHFFVLQTLKGAKIGDTTTKQYIVTSAMNDGDNQMSWNDIVAIEPRIANLQEIFKPVELSPEDRKFYDKYYEYGTDDESFCKFDYVTKRRYLDVYVMSPEKLLTDTQFKCLPEDLMNLYIGFGVGLTKAQFELIKSNKNLLKRYKQITERKFEEFLKNKNQNINFNYTELLILPENKREEYIMNLDSDGIYNLLLYSKEPEFINLLDNKGKEFIMNLDSDGIDYLLKHSKEPQKIINMLINIGGKEFIMNLDSNRISSLLVNSKEPEKIINLLGNKGKEFIMNLHSDEISWTNSRSNGIGYLLLRSKEPEKIINLLGNKGKEFIMNLDWDSIKNLYFVNKEAIKQIFQKYGKLSKEETKTPINEIFNSLTSLQEELTEQRKVTIKESNLMKVQNFIKKRKNNQ